MVLADYQSYVDAQNEAGMAYLDPEHWTRMSILNVARMGKFSSDRAIGEYCKDIWKVGPMDVVLKASAGSQDLPEGPYPGSADERATGVQRGMH
jgi:starch phosphorylase